MTTDSDETLMTMIADKYEIIRELGEGAYGKVFLVRHKDLKIEYAVKILGKQLADDDRFIERFRREAEILFRFSHPGTVALRDFGKTAEGQYYMATDYSPGTSLERVLAKEKWFSVLAALELVIQLLNVLEAAHAAGIVHRDIKPGNIMVESQPNGGFVVRVLDFGIAKMRETATEGARATIEGFAIGTPEYMSPEQAAGEADVDSRSDLYSVGAVFYELLTGEVPFRGETVIQTLLKHLTQKPAPFNESLGIPLEVEKIVFKALSKERTVRYQSAGEFKASCVALRDAFTAGAPVALQPPSAEAAFSVPANPSSHVPASSSISKTQPSVLLLDDNEMILNITKHILETAGYKVFVANNFSLIHDYIFKDKVRLMLCDVEMPGLPGTKICRMLKSSDPTLKIILFSNLPERELEKLAAECKADGYLSKGKSPREWLEAIREVESRPS